MLSGQWGHISTLLEFDIIVPGHASLFVLTTGQPSGIKLWQSPCDQRLLRAIVIELPLQQTLAIARPQPIHSLLLLRKLFRVFSRHARNGDTRPQNFGNLNSPGQCIGPAGPKALAVGQLGYFAPNAERKHLCNKLPGCRET